METRGAGVNLHRLTSQPGQNGSSVPCTGSWRRRALRLHRVPLMDTWMKGAKGGFFLFLEEEEQGAEEVEGHSVPDA